MRGKTDGRVSVGGGMKKIELRDKGRGGEDRGGTTFRCPAGWWGHRCKQTGVHWVAGSQFCGSADILQRCGQGRGAEASEKWGYGGRVRVGKKERPEMPSGTS